MLKGYDASGKAVISVPTERVEQLRKSRAVRSINTEVPHDWQPVRRLKLSYKADHKPTEGDLRKLGLRLIEDYQKGRFLVVEPVSGQVDARLAEHLETDARIDYAAPLFPFKAIQPPDS